VHTHVFFFFDNSCSFCSAHLHYCLALTVSCLLSYCLGSLKTVREPLIPPMESKLILYCQVEQKLCLDDSTSSSFQQVCSQIFSDSHVRGLTSQRTPPASLLPSPNSASTTSQHPTLLFQPRPTPWRQTHRHRRS